MLFNRSLFLLLATALYLSSCASTPPPRPKPTAASTLAHQQHLVSLENIKHFALKGRLGVITNPNGFSGGIDWQHQPDNDNVEVYSPFGSKVASISKTPSEVTLIAQDGRVVQAQDAETLTEATLGWRLPLSGLSTWVLGKPTDDTVVASEWNEQGQLISLKQSGWDITYDDYAENNGYQLPGKITLYSEKLRLKLLVEKWSGL